MYNAVHMRCTMHYVWDVIIIIASNFIKASTSFPTCSHDHKHERKKNEKEMCFATPSY